MDLVPKESEDVSGKNEVNLTIQPLDSSMASKELENEGKLAVNPTHLTTTQEYSSNLLGAFGSHFSTNIGLSQPTIQPSGLENGAVTNPLSVASLASMVTNLNSNTNGASKLKAIPGKPRNISATDPVKIISKRRLQELVTKIDPSERLDPEAEEILLEIADEFIESVTQSACRLAKHRKSQTLDVKDVQLHLERNWNIRIPGYANDDIRTIRRVTVPSSHINKLTAVSSAKASSGGSSQTYPSIQPQDEPAGEKV